MQLKHRVALDGVELDSIDYRIMIQKIEVADGKENISTVSLFGGSGSRVTNIHRDCLDITVKFTIRLRKTEMAAREEILEKVNAWAFAGGWLTTNYKENRKIKVFRAQAAGAGDPWNWTKEYAIVFRACGVPYFQEKNAETAMFTNVSSKNITFGVNGSEKSVLDVQFKNTSGSTINSFTISTGEASMTFSSLGLANGETLVIDHHDTGKKNILRIRIRSTAGVYRSAMAKRTSGSGNELTISPGTHTVAMTAGGAGTITVSCNGRFA